MATEEGRSVWSSLHVASLAVGLGVLVLAGRGQWFFGDEWDFLLYRGLHHARWSLLHPHNEHWSTLPILWYRGLVSLVGLKSYWPYLCTVFALHLIAAHCLWRLMRRASVTPVLATAAAAVFVFYGAGWENLTWAFQIGFVGSLAAGLALVLLVDDAGRSRRVALVAVGAVGALMISGISVVMVAALGLAASARWSWRKALLAIGPSAVVYALWSLSPGRVGLTGATSQFHGRPGDIPRFVWGGLSATLGAPFRNDGVGDVLLVALVALLVVRGRDWWRRAPEPMALAAAAPAMFAVISQGRGAFQSPAAPRYVYLAAGMLTPLVGFVVAQFAGRDARRGLLVVVTCATLGVVGADQLLRAAHPVRLRNLTLKGQLLASPVVAESEATLSDRPDFTYNRGMKVSDLVALDLAAATPSGRDVAQARLALQVHVARGKPAVTTLSAAATAPPGATVAQRGACATVDLRGGNAVIERRGDATAVFSLTASTKGEENLFIPYATGNAGPRTITLNPRRPVSVAEVVDGPLLLQLPPGNHIVCGLAWTNDLTTPFTIAGRRLGWGAWTATVIVSLGVLILRFPQSVVHPNLWAEDGQIFLRASLLEPWYRSLFDPYNGYVHVGLRAWAELMTLLPLSALAVAYSLFNLALFPLCLSVVLSRRLRWLIPSDATRAVAYVALLLMPGTRETLGNLTNGLWPIGIGMLLLSFCDEPSSSRRRVGELAAVAMAGLTGATCMLVFPGYALRWWRQRTRHNLVVFGVVLTTAVVQGLILLGTGRNKYENEPALRTVPRAFVLRIFGLLGLGEKTLADHVLARPVSVPVLLLCAALMAVTVAALLALPWIVRLHVAAVFALSAGATLWAYDFNVKGLSEGSGGGRYFLIPVTLVLLTVFAAACTPAWRRDIVRVGVLAPVAAFFVFSGAADLGLPALPATHWARTAACIEEHQPCEVVLNPRNWTFVLPPVST